MMTINTIGRYRIVKRASKLCWIKPIDFIVEQIHINIYIHFIRHCVYMYNSTLELMDSGVYICVYVCVCLCVVTSHRKKR